MIARKVILGPFALGVIPKIAVAARKVVLCVFALGTIPMLAVAALVVDQHEMRDQHEIHSRPIHSASDTQLPDPYRLSWRR